MIVAILRKGCFFDLLKLLFVLLSLLYMSASKILNTVILSITELFILLYCVLQTNSLMVKDCLLREMFRPCKPMNLLTEHFYRHLKDKVRVLREGRRVPDSEFAYFYHIR